MARLICESCGYGYQTHASCCSWCGAPPTVAHVLDKTATLDTECYADYWLARFGTGEVFEMFDGHPLDIEGLRQTLSKYRLVTFNGEGYDVPMISYALSGADHQTLKQISDHIIKNNVKPWELDCPRLDWLDHIDIMNVLPGVGGLKSYGARNHTRKIQDLPYKPDHTVRWPERVLLRDYCGIDLDVTGELFDRFHAQITLRENISAEYGVDVRSKSDPQIAEAVVKKLLSPRKIKPPYYAPGTPFYYHPPEWLKFQTLDILDKFTSLPMYITETGGVVPHRDAHWVDWGDKSVRLDVHGNWVTKPKGWTYEPLRINGTSYATGIGGLHSMESSVFHNCVLSDHDVASYYPALMIRLGIFPQQIGEEFLEIYRGWRDRRVAAKHAGDKKTADSLKTFLNGTFGKLGSKWSIFYAPTELIQVTVTGQLALLMLIEMLELNGILVVSANTDGIVVKCPAGLEWLRDQVIQWWEGVTQFETEQSNYRMLASRDINNYIAITTDGKAKLKGAFAPPEPGASGWPNPSGQVCVDAIVEMLTKGTPIEQTIRQCSDIKRFVYVQSVTGGGSVYWRDVLPKKASKREMAKYPDYDAAVAESMADSEYLGKVVRWYYATDSRATIRYSGSGNLVPRATGIMPLMELPDYLPNDIDYQWYINEANSLLKDIGI